MKGALRAAGPDDQRGRAHDLDRHEASSGNGTPAILDDQEQPAIPLDVLPGHKWTRGIGKALQGEAERLPSRVR